jgi:hypothetical protein
MRTIASLVMAVLTGLGIAGAARAQCYPGLACPTEQKPQTQPTPAPGPASGNEGPRTRVKGVEYHYVGPVRPPDDWLALRSLPTSRDGERIMKMPEGTLFRVGEKRGEWWFVTLRDGTKGWAHSNWIRCCRSIDE